MISLQGMADKGLVLSLIFCKLSSRGGLEVEGLLHKLHDSFLVGSNPARRQKDLYSN